MSHSGAATYKKNSGMINIDEDQSPAEFIWRSTSGNKVIKIVLDTIDKLQATPASSDKMMLRLISKVPSTPPPPQTNPLGLDHVNKKLKLDPAVSKITRENSDASTMSTPTTTVSPTPLDTPSAPVKPVTYMFTFNNRTVMDNIKITLQHIISRYKDDEIWEEKKRKESSQLPLDSSLSNSNLSDATNGITSTANGHSNLSVPLINTSALDDSLSKSKLLINFKLQQSLLKENKPLMRIFQDTVIHSGLPPEEFWSTRISQLRAFALSTSQKIGPYNVLSTIKPVASSDNKVNVNISREKISSIFSNYPIVKKAYTDNVPKNFKEPEFWARFFSSKLFRKLRGEKIMQNDRGDVIIDRYLKLDQEYDRKDDEMLLHPVKKSIDLDGNLEDDPVRRGNKQDFTMQPGVDINGNSDGTIDILKGMNRLSEKMILSLENEYSRSNLQNNNNDDMDKIEVEEIQINDLKDNSATDYAMIHLNMNQHVSTKDDEDSVSSLNGGSKTKITKEEIKEKITQVTESLVKEMDLTQVEEKGSNINSEINKRVIGFVKINAKQAKHNNLDSTLGTFIGNDKNAKDARTDIPTDLLESCRMLHTTCCEFLKHFYIHFQSGEPKQANLVKKLYIHLKDCSEKIHELLSDVKQGDGEQVAMICNSYLRSTLASLHLAIEKYDNVTKNFQEKLKRMNTPIQV
ncbi:hypothetical protein TBLA_0A03030 [Henningerozyma blattae CBS 6284]|uniref:BSD domain-containing protein n=1 Tax=Henningerozyma blattae (strain ATCC 34711 / CBS 6284 / DSM 70876 / NBRC 10599 / NRRL Y-10934 / UCD 77-7) TaxID=1071380 RepID=I2GVF1_HENB6|nr:hypothetical protein TBLA_0A03030 [Tetrapisispora blattae CBS 6284]CCH58103.1 hypothetical protein TBLA_0A03030 [Tetrapisispora blattae CBS 6284]